MPRSLRAVASSGVKAWNFLLPDTGLHHLHVENLGMKSQSVFVDGVKVELLDGSKEFAGPGASVLELRRNFSILGHSWDLVVNGLVVKDAQSGDTKSSHLSRSRSAAKNKKLLRRYIFRAKGEEQQIEIEHAKWVWQVLVNGVVHHQQSHSYWENHHSASFMATTTRGDHVDIEVDMQWDARKTEWRYNLLVNRKYIPVSWTRTCGDALAACPEVIDSSAALEGKSELRAIAACGESVQDLDSIERPAPNAHQGAPSRL
mmetsp:Transcript_44639/g.105878  ORF Transcript_44639/g.105878 Transcript_44639/m.105878 type:complete len:259 (-) Transcript_44639:189-965(-)